MQLFHFSTSKLSVQILNFTLLLGVSSVFVFLASTSSVYAEPSVSGISGIVTDTNDDPVEDVSIEFSCATSDEYWPQIAQTNSSGEYERLGIYDGNLGCEGSADGNILKVRATKDGYISSAEVALVTIDYAAASAVNLAEWTDWYFATLRTQNFVIEQLPPGWTGTVRDDDTYDVLEGVTFSLMCEGQAGVYNFPSVSSDADGEYAISKAQFETALNFIGCYYNSDPFYVNVTASFEGYLDATISVYDVDPGDMGASFDLAVTRDFYMEGDPSLNYAEGDGGEDDPFIIDSVERFEAISEFSDGADGLYFALVTDLTFTGDEDRNGFSGFLDGRDHSISGATQSLFSDLDGATVSNLFIDADLEYETSENYLGLLAGEMEAGAYVENVHVSGSIAVECTSGSCQNIGGLVGLIQDESHIHQSSADVTIDTVGNDVFYIGGLVGSIHQNSEVTESYATGDVNGSSNVGGLVGSISSGADSLIADSYATGDVHSRGGSYSNSGGLVGTMENGTVLRAYATGAVSSPNAGFSGGFVGNIEGNSRVLNSFTAALDTTDTNNIGGYLGRYYGGEIRNGAWVTLPNTDAVASISEYSPVDCSVAPNDPRALLDGAAPCDFGTDMSSVAQFTENGYNGAMAPVYLDAEDSWDFENVWDFDADINGGLPYLRWSGEEVDEEPEEEVEEETPSRSSSSGGTRGTRRTEPASVTESAPAVTVASASVREIILSNKTLFMAARDAGIVLPKMITDIINGSLNTPSFESTGADVRDLTLGLSGEDVKALQELLMIRGYSIPAGATGYFGTQTRDALALYQEKAGIVPAAGYFGAMTRAEMKSSGLTGLWW